MALFSYLKVLNFLVLEVELSAYTGGKASARPGAHVITDKSPDKLTCLMDRLVMQRSRE